MGIKYEGDEVFDPVMKALLDDAWVRSDTVQKVAFELIRGLMDNHWSTPENSLAAFEDNPHIVAAFKAHGVMLDCGEGHPGDGESCEGLKRGHEEPHQDYLGRTWTDEEVAK